MTVMKRRKPLRTHTTKEGKTVADIEDLAKKKTRQLQEM
jgi:hypothetical protein